MTLPAPRLHPDNLADIVLPSGGSVISPPRMVTNFCHRAEGNAAAPCTCGMCDVSDTAHALESPEIGLESSGVARWRVTRCPLGRYSVLSDREPGPVMGARGGLYGWEIIPGARWQTFEEACLEAATHNGKVSTANMGPQHAAERAGAT